MTGASPTGAWDWLCIGDRGASVVEVAASAPAVRLGSELRLKLCEAPDPGAVRADVGLDAGGRLMDGGEVDAEQLRAALQRCRDRPAQVRVVPGPHWGRLPNRCSSSNREWYLPRPVGPLGHIGGTEPRPARVNSGQSWKGRDLVDGSFRRCATGRESGRLALLRQRFGVRVPGGAPQSAQPRPGMTPGLLVCLVCRGPRWGRDGPRRAARPAR
jgi:hypothetical protein